MSDLWQGDDDVACDDRRNSAERWVRLLDADPDLGQALEPGKRADLARRHVVARLATARAGAWDPAADLGEPTRGAMGLLILSGVLCHRTHVLDKTSVELLGPGDAIRPWDPPAELHDGEVRSDWRVLRHTELALLDFDAAVRMCRWPELLAELTQRLNRRVASLAMQLTTSHVTGVDVRLDLLMRHIAMRWGRVTSDGILVPLVLTNDVLGSIIGARRPSVSAAAAKLSREGRLERCADNTWLLPRPGARANGSGGRFDSAALDYSYAPPVLERAAAEAR